MNFFIHQNIVIHTLKIDGISNSSVFQVGSAGVVKPVSNLYNTGGFTQAAPSLEPSGPGASQQPSGQPQAPSGQSAYTPLVPLVGPSM